MRASASLLAEKGTTAMVDINLDLVLQGQLDLRIAGSIGLFNGDGDKRARIQHLDRPRIQHSPRSDEQEPGYRVRWDEMEREAGPSPGGSRLQPRRAVGRAATKTRQAISAVKEAMKSDDDQRKRQATEQLKQATVRLHEAVRRASDATASGKEPDALDAEFEETH
jgi:hypothetical protein